MKLPVVSGKELSVVLQKHGFSVLRQRGSHILLSKTTEEGTIKVTVPNHRELKKGTLHRILKDAGLKPEDIE